MSTGGTSYSADKAPKSRDKKGYRQLEAFFPTACLYLAGTLVLFPPGVCLLPGSRAV